MYVLGLLLYYGSVLPPLGYLIATGFRGGQRGAFLGAFRWHLLASLGVMAYTYGCYLAGYRQWYWAMAFNVPVNGIFALAYAAVFLGSAPPRQSKNSVQPQPQDHEPSDFNRDA
jgi:hypothetical protein